MSVTSSSPCELLAALHELRQEVAREGEGKFKAWSRNLARQDFAPGALNLAHYLALRSRDLRDLQLALMPLGLSSLGRSEGHVMPTLMAVERALAALAGAPLPGAPVSSESFFEGEAMLGRETERLFGPSPDRRRMRIMVTLPTEAAEQPNLIRDLLAHGMNCARINCAHDDEPAWLAMIQHVRAAEAETRRGCRVLMDLCGPKLRTGKVSGRSKRRLRIGDSFLLARDSEPRARRGITQSLCEPGSVLEQVAAGGAVWVDDGKLGGKIERLNRHGALVRVTHARSAGVKLKPDKGLNFPGADLKLDPLSKADLRHLDFVARHADIVGYSFVQDAAGIKLLQRELEARRPLNLPPVGIVAKIETERAVRNLTRIIVAAAGRQPFAVMIARGDLAVEIGYPRLAEIQEEILWICEAARVPVIWATQVMESFVKTGMPSRAEMTDAAMAQRAECVMLNKGPYAVDAVALLNDVLARMETHQLKKTARLRALSLANADDDPPHPPPLPCQPLPTSKSTSPAEKRSAISSLACRTV